MIERIRCAAAAAGTFLRSLTAWQRLGVAFVAGLFSALGFAPFNFFPALLLSFATLVVLIDGTEGATRRSLLAGSIVWAFGFGQYALGMHWIAYAFLVDPGSHAWQIPAVFIFFALLALFQFVAGALAVCYWRKSGRIFFFALCYGGFEWLRGHLFTGFPWNLPAYSWGVVPGVLQSTAIFGAYSLSLLTVLFGASLAELFGQSTKWKLPAALTAIFVLLWLGGSVRLVTAEEHNVPGVVLRLVQPNIPQAEKYQRRYVLRNWKRLIDLSRGVGGATLTIWPEAAPPFLLDEQPLALRQIADLTRGGQGLLTGAIRRELATDNSIRYANSFFLFGRNGTMIATYDKSHLVPFGEYLPFEETLKGLGLEKLTGIDGSFSPGDGPHAYPMPGAGTLTPLICYEILFPGDVVGAQRPDWLVNVTDDSWFGPWAGPRQHLLVARVRAVEEGLPVARAANTGISAIIDPFGRITSHLGLNQTGVVDGKLPAAIAQTPYSRFRELWFLLLVCAIVALTWRFSIGK